MSMKPLPVSGYTEQSNGNVSQVNFNKKLEELVLRVVDEHLAAGEIDKRWAAVAKTHFEQGFMALNRSVFQPTRIEGDLSAGEFFELLEGLD